MWVIQGLDKDYAAFTPEAATSSIPVIAEIFNMSVGELGVKSIGEVEFVSDEPVRSDRTKV